MSNTSDIAASRRVSVDHSQQHRYDKSEKNKLINS